VVVGLGFSVNSYGMLKWNSLGFNHKFLWKFKFSTKIRVLLWLLLKRSVHTKDVLVLHWRGWKRQEDLCEFCGDKEIIDHMFFVYPMSNSAWSVACCAFNFAWNVSDLFDDWLLVLLIPVDWWPIWI
jgi:hypothetical protein